MPKETYEKPEFDFHEMSLFERIADVCWGTAQVWLDTNRDGATTDGLDIHFETSGGCQGSWSSDELTAKINEVNAVLESFNSSEQDYDILSNYNPSLGAWAIENKVSSISPITASPSSNWANSKAKSGSGIIIIHS